MGEMQSVTPSTCESTENPTLEKMVAIHICTVLTYHYYYTPDCKPQIEELDAKNSEASAGKTAQCINQKISLSQHNKG